MDWLNEWADFSCWCFSVWREYTPWSVHFPWLDFPSFFFHLSESFEAQIKAHFLEIFVWAHWDHSFFKSIVLITELFIWYSVISPLRSEMIYISLYSAAFTIFPVGHIPVCPPLSLSFSKQFSHNACVGYYSCLWIRHLFLPGMHMIPGGRYCILWLLSVLSSLLNDGRCYLLCPFKIHLPCFPSAQSWELPFLGFYKYHHSE